MRLKALEYIGDKYVDNDARALPTKSNCGVNGNGGKDSACVSPSTPKPEIATIAQALLTTIAEMQALLGLDSFFSQVGGNMPLSEERCPKCRKLMFKGNFFGYVEVKCRECGYMVKIAHIEK